MDFLLSGGGAKGICYVGVLKYILSKDIPIKRIGGVSIGSVFGLIYILCKMGSNNINNIEKHILDAKFDEMFKVKMKNILNKWGLCDCNEYMNFFKKFLHDSNLNEDITFKGLYLKSNIKYEVFVTNLTKNEQEILCEEKTPNLKVLDAIRMSISLPIIFTRKIYNGCVYTDGGILENFPINLFKKNDDKFLGIKLCEKQKEGEIKNILQFIIKNIDCMRKKNVNEKEDCIIYLEPWISTFHIKLSKEEKIKLIEFGEKRVIEFFNEKNEKEY